MRIYKGLSVYMCACGYACIWALMRRIVTNLYFSHFIVINILWIQLEGRCRQRKHVIALLPHTLLNVRPVTANHDMQSGRADNLLSWGESHFRCLYFLEVLKLYTVLSDCFLNGNFPQ